MSSSHAFLKELSGTSIPISWKEGSDPAYPRSLFWNHGIDHLPLAIVQPRHAEDIQLAVKLASKHNVKVGVLNAGGHDSRGRAISPGTLCLDLSKHFRDVTFDQTRMEARVGGGCNFYDVVPHLPEGYEMSMGTVKSVGVPGLYTGGGFGYITHIVGIGADLLNGATVVLADGSVVECDDNQHTDLMWGLRGGGGGFGVILELRIKIFQLPKMLHASITWPLVERQAVHEAFQTYQDLLEEYPDQISVFGRISTIPNIGPGLGLVVTFHGTPDVAEAAIDRLAHIPHAKVLKRNWEHFKDMLDPMAEKAAPRGGYYHTAPQSFTRFAPSVVDVLIDAHLAEPHGKCILHDMHGISCRRKVDETAFPKRTPHLTMFIVGACGLGGETATPELREQTAKWADNLVRDLSVLPDTVSGGHPSLLHPAATDKVKEWFGPNAERLKRLREELDPEGRFRGATGDMRRVA